MDLKFKQRNCEFDSCRTGACSSLEQAADECKKEGFCIDWRELTNGSCSMYTLSKFSFFSFIYLCTVTVFDSKLISELFLFMFQAWRVLKAWFMMNAVKRWMTSAMEGLSRLPIASLHSLLNPECSSWIFFFFFLFTSLYRVRYTGASLERPSTGCFCPSGQFRAANRSHICVSECPCEYKSHNRRATHWHCDILQA